MVRVERAGLWSRSESWESANCSRVFNVQWMHLCPNGLHLFRFRWDVFLQDRWYLMFVCRQLPRDSEYLCQADTGRRILTGMLVSTSVDMLFLRLPIRERWGNIWICDRLKYILHVMFCRGNVPKMGQPGLTGSHTRMGRLVMPGSAPGRMGQIGKSNHLMRRDVSS